MSHFFRKALAFPAAVLLVGLIAASPPPSVPNAVVQPTTRDWPMFGGSPARNMVNLKERGLPDTWDVKTGKNIKWVARLGSRAYGCPVVAGGKVFVGTNNEWPRNDRDRAKPDEGEDKGRPLDKGILMCFRTSNGRFLWQAVHDRLESTDNNWPREGICSSPAVVGHRLYYVSNRCELVCADTEGFLDGVNDGAQDEQYNDPTDADIIWRLDMMKDLGVFPHNMSNCSPLVVGDLVFVCTSNGVEGTHLQISSPTAPSFIAVNRHTGRLVWQDNSPGKNILHGQWSSPAYAEVMGVPQVIFPGGDGWLRAFEPRTGNLIWKFDCNPKDAVHSISGKGTRSEFIAAPAIWQGKLYIGTGQDPEHFDGVGHLWCVDLARAVANGRTNADHDVSPVDNNFDPNTLENRQRSALVWHYGGLEPNPAAKRDYIFGRTMSTCAVHDGLVYAAEIAGYLHCVDARTGERYWVQDVKSAVWGSPLWVDGKIYLPNEDGDVWVFRHGKQLKRLAKVEMNDSIRVAPVAANGVLYLMGEKALYAIQSRRRSDD